MQKWKGLFLGAIFFLPPTTGALAQGCKTCPNLENVAIVCVGSRCAVITKDCAWTAQNVKGGQPQIVGKPSFKSVRGSLECTYKREDGSMITFTPKK